MTERRANTRWKVIGSRILLGLYCLTLPLSLVAIWANNLVLDTDMYVDTVAPLAADPEIQEAIATRLTDLVSGRIQRDSSAWSALVGGDGVLRGAGIAIVLYLVDQAVLTFVQSPEFESFWISANETAHARLTRVLLNENERPVSVENGQLILDLGPMVTRVEDRLASSGFDVFGRVQIEPFQMTLVLAESERLGTIQEALRILDVLAVVLPIVAVTSLVACLILARHRWSMLMWAGVSTAVAMAIVLLLLGAARDWYLDGLDPGRSEEAFAALFDIVGRNLRSAARSLALIALGVGGLAAIASSSWARQPRIVQFVKQNHSKLLAGLVAVLCLVLIAVNQLSLELAIGVGVLSTTAGLAILWLSRLPITIPSPVATGPELIE